MEYSKGRHNSTGLHLRPAPLIKRLPGYYFSTRRGHHSGRGSNPGTGAVAYSAHPTVHIFPEAAYYNFVPSSDLSHIAVLITRWFFFALTAGVMIPVTVIIILEVIRRFINRNRPEPAEPDNDSRFELLELLDRSPRNPNITADRVEGEYIKRFDVHQRIQHYGLFITFIILAVTGVLRGFPDWPTFAFFTNLFGGPDLLRLVHDAAAFGMIAVCIYHIIYVIHGIVVKRKLPTAIGPQHESTSRTFCIPSFGSSLLQA
jgi:cytochrome b subunit of formate dehydrogenase